MRGAFKSGRGIAVWSSPAGETSRETFTCCHCQGVRLAPRPGDPEIGFCHHCFARECIPCAKRLGGRCTPFEQRIENYERRNRMLISVTG